MSQPGKSLSPFQQGFAALWSDPALMAGELVWRWCFGFSAWGLAFLSAGLLLDSLVVSPADQLLLATLQPMLLRTATNDIVRGSLLRFVWVDAILLVGLTLLWTFAATAGRAATLRRMVEMFRGEDAGALTWRFRPIFTLNLLRAVWSITAIAAAGASLVLGIVAARQQHAARAAFFLVFSITLACVFGYLLNWLLGLAPLFCVREEVGTSEAIVQTVEFCSDRAGRIFGLSVAFIAVWVVWSGTMMMFQFAALSLAKYVGLGWVLLLMALLGLVYFAGADLIYLARLGAYAALAEDEAAPREVLPEWPIPPEEAPSVESPTNLEPA